MSEWYEDGGGKRFLSCKEGQTLTFVLKEIRQVKDQPKFDPKDKTGKPQGWHLDLISADDKVLSVSSFALQGKIKVEYNRDRAAGVAKPLVGRKLTIEHPGRGDYKLTVGELEMKPDSDSIPF